MSYKPNICKKCGGRKPIMQPTCGLGWEMETAFDTPEDYTCKCKSIAISSWAHVEKKHD